MPQRRPMGSLEAEVMSVLWDSSDALTPAAIRDLLDADIAYTTVTTVLTRLWKKGLVARLPASRGYAYVAALSEPAFRANRMERELDLTTNRAEVLSRFVDQLSDSDASVLRRMLKDLDSE